MNDIFKSQVKPGGHVEEAYTQDDFDKQAVTDKALQTYFTEASRTVNLNIYQVQIKHQHKKEVVTKYFINRIEVGHTL